MRRLLAIVVGASLVALTFVSSTAPAQASGAREMSYQGRLDLDGVPMNGLFNFKFELHSSPSEGDCSVSPRPESCLWMEEHVDVDVTAGIFSVVLGSAGAPLPDSLWQHPEIYLGVRVASPDEPYALLSGRQRILSLPAATRADTARDYRVTGSLRVDGDVTIQGGLEVLEGAMVRGGLVVDTPTAPSSSREFTVDAAGNVRLEQLTAVALIGSMTGQILGGVTLTCDWDRVVRRTCSSWLTGRCDGGALPMSECGVSSLVGCAENGGTLRMVAQHRCYHAVGYYNNYCYFYLCVRE